MKIKFKKPKTALKSKLRQPKAAIKRQELYSYRSSRQQETRPYDRGSEAGKKTDLKQNLIRYPLTIILLLITAYSAALTPNAELKFSGQPIVDRPVNSVQTMVNQNLKESFLNYSKLTLDSKKLAAELAELLPDASEVKVSIRPFGLKPIIKITYSTPAAKLVTLDGNYILDNYGKVVSSEEQIDRRLNLSSQTTINDSISRNIQPGQSVMNQGELEFINEILSQSDSNKLAVDALSLGNGSELIAKYKDTSYLVRYSTNTDPRQSSGAYFALRDQLKHENKTPRQYVDLRIPDRAYIK